MGKRWNRRLEVEDSTGIQPIKQRMIEHTISPYQTQTTSYSNTTYRRVMSVEEYNTYLKQAEEKGFKIGAKVRTGYGAEAHIVSVKPTDKPIDVWSGKTLPDCFLIHRVDQPTPIQMGYNETELTLI